MIINYLKLAYRKAVKHKGMTFINVFGLSIAMAFCIIIMLFIQYELSYDKHINNSDRIYRIASTFDFSGSVNKMATTPGNAGAAFMNSIPEIEAYTRVGLLSNNDGFVVEYDSGKIEDYRLLTADSSFFDLINYKFVYGNPSDALLGTNSIVITKSISHKLFGEINPIGKHLKLFNRDFQISAVVDNENLKSHLNFNYLIPFKTIESGNDERYNNWLRFPICTYISLIETADNTLLPQKMQDVFRKDAGEYADKWGAKVEFELQAIPDIHLKSNLAYELESNSDINYVYYFAIIGLLILVVAIINFINLVTALSFSRANEIGLRKAFGGSRKQLIWQFLSESLLTTLISLWLALIMVGLILPYYNLFTGMNFSNLNIWQSSIISGMVLMFLLSGFGAGIYPAFVLSNCKPITTLHGELTRGIKRNKFMKLLVVFQFAITAILIFSTLIIQKQVSFMKNMEMSFSPEQTLVIKAKTRDTIKKGVFIKNEMLKNPQITQSTFSYTYPGLVASADNAYFLDEKNESETVILRAQYVDFDYIDVFGLSMVEGRKFDINLSSDSTNAYILNETAVKLLNITGNIIGKKLNNASQGNDGIVIGVVKDFHQESLKNDIVPLIYQTIPAGGSYLALKIKPENITKTLAWIQEKWTSFEPDRNMEYFFMDDFFDQLYKSEKNMGNLFLVFSLVIIVIASMGLFGLVSFITLQKTKEIGIRRVNGATVFEIVNMLNYNFIKWVAIGFVIAVPIAWYIMNRWLQNFAYKTELSWWVFALAGFAALFVTMLTVTWISWKAATRNPIEALRYE